MHASILRTHNNRGTPTKREEVSVVASDCATVNFFEHYYGLLNCQSQGVVRHAYGTSISSLIFPFLGRSWAAVACRLNVTLTQSSRKLPAIEQAGCQIHPWRNDATRTTPYYAQNSVGRRLHHLWQVLATLETLSLPQMWIDSTFARARRRPHTGSLISKQWMKMPVDICRNWQPTSDGASAMYLRMTCELQRANACKDPGLRSICCLPPYTSGTRRVCVPLWRHAHPPAQRPSRLLWPWLLSPRLCPPGPGTLGTHHSWCSLDGALSATRPGTSQRHETGTELRTDGRIGISLSVARFCIWVSFTDGPTRWQNPRRPQGRRPKLPRSSRSLSAPTNCRGWPRTQAGQAARSLYTSEPRPTRLPVWGWKLLTVSAVLYLCRPTAPPLWIPGPAVVSSRNPLRCALIWPTTHNKKRLRQTSRERLWMGNETKKWCPWRRLDNKHQFEPGSERGQASDAVGCRHFWHTQNDSLLGGHDRDTQRPRSCYLIVGNKASAHVRCFFHGCSVGVCLHTTFTLHQSSCSWSGIKGKSGRMQAILHRGVLRTQARLCCWVTTKKGRSAPGFSGLQK